MIPLTFTTRVTTKHERRINSDGELILELILDGLRHRGLDIPDKARLELVDGDIWRNTSLTVVVEEIKTSNSNPDDPN